MNSTNMNNTKEDVMDDDYYGEFGLGWTYNF